TAQRPPDGDEPWYLLLTHSIASDGDIDLADEYAGDDSLRYGPRRLEPQPGDPVGEGGARYSRHNVLLPLVLAPAYRVAGLHGALATMALLAAVTAWQALLLMGRLFPRSRRGRRAAWAILAFAPPLLLYSYQVWVEVPAALLTVLAVRALLAGRPRPRGTLQWIGILAPIVLLPLLKLRFVLVAAGLAAAAAVRIRPSARQLLALAGVGAGFAVTLLVVNAVVFDDPLKGRSWDVLQIWAKPPAAFARGLAGIFFDASFGLIPAAPIWLLLAPATVAVFRRHRRLLGYGLLIGAPYLAFVVADAAWYGGWCPPFRYPLLFLPLLATLLVPLLDPPPGAGAKTLLWALLLPTVALAVLWVTVPGWTYNHALGRSHLIDHLSNMVGADVSRFTPSYFRPRLASWLWPLLAVPGAFALWQVRGRRLRRLAFLGAAVAVAALPVAMFAAQRLPTRVLELEDPVGRRGDGPLFPHRWEPTRTAYPGSWRIWDGDRVSWRLVPGSDRFDLELTLYFSHRCESAAIELAADDTPLASVPLTEPWRWRTVTVEGLSWPDGATSLGIGLVVEGDGVEGSDLILDRARLLWR
ncbi:MAG: hypothetical protein R3190_05920, partial [Thermoanaerobaculia bacterium]|nr:hypothetical protein [Thermoanaerobaculia bacterium]